MFLAISLILSTLCSFAKPITRADAVSSLSVPLVQSHSLEGKYPSIVSLYLLTLCAWVEGVRYTSNTSTEASSVAYLHKDNRFCRTRTC